MGRGSANQASRGRGTSPRAKFTEVTCTLYIKAVVGAMFKTRGPRLNTHNIATISHINLTLSRCTDLPCKD